ncbi:PD-(D/E)XK nuclease family protein [Eionea flava]
MPTLPSLFNLSRILPLVEKQQLILTPNNRLRSKILQAWGHHQREQGVSVWDTPRIFTVEQWFEQQWEMLQAHGHPDSAQTIINSEQQRIIWESITADCGLMQVDAVAKQASSAYTTLVRWNQPVDTPSIHADINPQFKAWIQRFQQRLEQLHFITLEDSYGIIGQAFAQRYLKTEATIHLLGFDDLPPLVEKQLNKACEKLVLLSHADYSPSSTQRMEYDTPDAEMRAAAQWARTIIQQQPNTRIGIIVPNLGQCRQQVEQAFIAEFEAHSLLPQQERYTLPFNFSAGTPLGDTPLIASTLQLLRLQEQRGQQQARDVEFLSHCLLSPFWGKYSEELTQRCALVNKLTSLGTFTISGDTLRYWAQRIGEQSDRQRYRGRPGMTGSTKNNSMTGGYIDTGMDASTGAGMGDMMSKDGEHHQPVISANAGAHSPPKTTSSFRRTPESMEAEQTVFDYLHAFHQYTNHTRNQGKHLPSRWVEIFLEQLDILHWPGERTPDSQEYQQTQLWYQLLETFASLDSVLQAIDSSTALQQLQRMANQLPFQAKVPDSPVQILGILEGAGLHFNHCWIMGLHQKVWPPAPAPNSLLPIRLQREHNMPHASSLRELAYAQSLTDNYRHCADHIIFSSPTHEDDSEQALLVSQLIRDIPLASTLAHTSAHDSPYDSSNDSLDHWYSTLKSTQALTLVDCANAPTYTSDTLTGGSGVFKAQADNPFDSFVKYRLGAPLPIEPSNGFSHIEKGHILHNSLAAIWQELRTQAALLALSDDELNEKINEQLTLAINDIRRHKPNHLSDVLCNIERERQHRLLQQWFTVEKERPPFTVVAIEEAHTVVFNGLNINIRIDRVDQLLDGRFLIIDYKTGSATQNAWKGDRPKEPQLPLYALTYNKDCTTIKGISFAQINVKAQQFSGLGDGQLASGITSIEKNRLSLPDTWESTLNHWQAVLDQLLQEFIQGQCTIHYNDDVAKRYAGDYLRINRFYEADAINTFDTHKL